MNIRENVTLSANFQLHVLCIIFYQCLSAMICTLYSGHNYAFIISKSQRAKFGISHNIQKDHHDGIAVLLIKLSSILFILP